MLAEFIGKKWHEGVSELEIAAATGKRFIQVIPHGHAATMELNAARIRVWLDANNRIEKITAG